MLSKIPLRVRLTILTCSILFAACISITIISVMSAGNIFFAPFESMYVQPSKPVPIVPDDETPKAQEPSIDFTDAYGMFEDSKRGFAFQSLVWMLVIILAGTVLTWLVAGKALKPVVKLSSVIEDIDVNNLSQKIPVPPSKDEIARLTQSFNNMLCKINSSFQSQKTFAQNAAHELKTPLSAIIANIEVVELEGDLIDPASIDEYKETLQLVKQNAERMSSLVSDLLMLNAVESHAETSRFSMRDLLLSIIEDNESDIRKKNITVNADGEKEVDGNRFMFERAFSNIILNAIRYNHINGSIIIRCEESGITISDTGIGIPNENLPHIFEPFYCVNASRSRASGGSGLGLAITKEIFDKYGIEVNVTSGEGLGTTITVTNL